MPSTPCCLSEMALGNIYTSHFPLLLGDGSVHEVKKPLLEEKSLLVILALPSLQNKMARESSGCSIMASMLLKLSFKQGIVATITSMFCLI